MSPVSSKVVAVVASGDFQKQILGHTQEHNVGTVGQDRGMCFLQTLQGKPYEAQTMLGRSQHTDVFAHVCTMCDIVMVFKHV